MVKYKSIQEAVNDPKFFQHVLPNVYKIFEKTQDPKKIQEFVSEYFKSHLEKNTQNKGTTHD